MRDHAASGASANDLGSTASSSTFPDIKLLDRVELDSLIVRCLADDAPPSWRAKLEDEARDSQRVRLAIDRSEWISTLLKGFHAMPAGDKRDAATLPREVGPVAADGRRYELVRDLGSGSFARVYLALDRLLSSPDHDAFVAIKAIAGETPDALLRARQEAQRMRTVEHECVVRVTDFGEADGKTLFIVQEWVAGGTLKQWLDDRDTPARPREIVALIARLVGGLQAVHSAGLVHHDLQPQNILIAGDGTPKIIDFGSAGSRQDGAPEPSTAGPGVLLFSAPELLHGGKRLPSPTTDVYSIGALLGWALVRRHGQRDDAHAAALALLAPDTSAAERAAQLQSHGVERDLRAIVMRAMSHDTSIRYGSASELQRDLDLWLTRKPIAWTKPGIGKRVKLLARRRPVSLVGSIALAASVVVAAMSIQSARSERAWKAEAATLLEGLLRSFAAATEQGIASELLASLWYIEWSHGPILLDDPTALHMVWDTRIEALEQYRASIETEAGAGSVAAHLADASLALWYLRAERPAEAKELLARSLAYWKERARASDPWLAQLELLDAIATAELASKQGELALLASALERIESGLSTSMDRSTSPVNALARETLGQLADRR